MLAGWLGLGVGANDGLEADGSAKFVGAGSGQKEG